jgi:hypothetical protein
MGGLLAALIVGGIVLDRVTAPQGTTGSLGEVLPTARARARAWSPNAALVGLEGRDLIDGRNGDRGAWKFAFADVSRQGRYAEIVLGRNVLVLRERTTPPESTSGGPYDDGAFRDTPELAGRLVAYGMRRHSPATFSLEASPSEPPAFRVATAGRLAATWWVDARSGDLLDYRSERGK